MATSDKFMSLSTLKVVLASWRKKGGKVVFTNGCFDLLHAGHVDYLEKAGMLGDRLVVGLNSDKSVKSIKGNSRPVTGEDARGKVLAALSFVDAVVLFDEETPYNLITAVKPDILVKGNDYDKDNIIGADFVNSHGGSIYTIPLLEGFSTTSLINKVKQL